MNGVTVTFMYCEVIAVVTQSIPSHFGNNKNNKYWLDYIQPAKGRMLIK